MSDFTEQIIEMDSAKINEIEEIRSEKLNQDIPQIHNAEIIGFLSGKGGVGKTGIAINIANFCSEYNEKVLLVDCDMGTNGATTFFSAKKLYRKDDNQGNHNCFNDIVTELLNEVNFNIKQKELKNVVPLEIKDNFDFIPVCIDGIEYDEKEFSKNFMLELEKVLSYYFSEWRKKYDIILVDFGAGEKFLNNVMIKLLNKICIVMSPNKISKEAVQIKLQYLFSKIPIKHIKCCLNMIPRGMELNSAVNCIDDFLGFQKSENYSELFDNGKMIKLDDGELCSELYRIVKNLRTDEKCLLEHKNKIEKIKKEKEQLQEDREQQLRKKIKKQRMIGCSVLTVIAAIIYAICLFYDAKVTLLEYWGCAIIIIGFFWVVLGKGRFYEGLKSVFVESEN